MTSWVKKARDRRSVRRSVAVDCQVVAEEGFRLIGERTLDLSEQGMLLRSDAEVLPGESVIISMRAPRSRLWLDAEARVVRLVAGRRGRDVGRAVGLRFERMDAIDYAVLVGSLRGLPPPLPGRELRVDYAAAIRDIAGF